MVLCTDPTAIASIKIGGIADRQIYVALNIAILGLQNRVALVAGSKHGRHALPPEPPQLLTQRRMAAAEYARIEPAAKAQVDALHHQGTGLFVQASHRVERLDDPGVLALALIVENLEAVKRSARRHSGVSLAIDHTLASNNSGHVRAMAVAIELVKLFRTPLQEPWVAAVRTILLRDDVAVLRKCG